MLLPEKSELGYINQFPFFEKKVKKVYELLDEEKMEAAERICLGLAEAIGLVFLKKKYSVEVASASVVLIAYELIKKNEKAIAELYISINGNLNTLGDSIEVDDVGSFLYDIDFLLEKIIKENADLNEVFQTEGENHASDEEGILEEIRKWVLNFVDKI